MIRKIKQNIRLTFILWDDPKWSECSQSPETPQEWNITSSICLQNPCNNREENNGEIKNIPRIFQVSSLTIVETHHNTFKNELTDEDDGDGLKDQCLWFFLVFVN